MSFKRFILLLVSIFLVSCSSIITQNEINERAAAESIISESFPKEYPINIHRVKNLSKNNDVDYLEKAIPDIIEGMLNPAKRESAYIELKEYQPSIPDKLDALVTGSNTIFPDYITNKLSQITQYVALLMTNTNEVLSGDSNIIVVNIDTNGITTNMISTNLPYFNKSMYYTFITNEFSGLIDRLSFIPVKVNNKSRESSTDTNTNAMLIAPFYMDITGTFRILSKKNGPNALSIDLKIKYINEITNIKELSIKCREDQVADRLHEILKDIRTAFLNRSTGDLLVVTDPEDANIYLDGNYIGKSPLYYPGVIDGTHQIVLLKEGYLQGNVQVDILKNKTNLISTAISSWERGGEVTIETKTAQAQVFVDSLYRGLTPLTITNLELNKEHRVKIISDQKGLKPYYRNFFLKHKDHKVTIKAELRDYEGSHTDKKKAAWNLTYGAWGLTIGVIGWNIYSHYQKEHFQDLFNVYGTQNYFDQLSSFSSMENSSFTIGIVTGIVAGTITAYALSTEELFLGLDMKDDTPMAIFGIRF